MCSLVLSGQSCTLGKTRVLILKMKGNMADPILEDLNRIAQVLYDKKGFNILVLDVTGVCSMTDYFVIAEGSVDRHVRALSQTIEEEWSQKGKFPLHSEGQKEGDWVVLDYGDIVIHLFTPDLRDKYRLEELWHDGKVVDVKIETGRPELKKREDI